MQQQPRSSPTHSTRRVLMGRGRGQRGRSTSPCRVGFSSFEESRSSSLDQGASPTDPDELFGRMKLDVSPSAAGGSPRVARRGSRADHSDTVRTRPMELKSKQGNRGTPTRMVTNYFPLIAGPMWKLYRYHVYFEPLMDDKNTRHKILKSHKEELGAYIYNGTNLFTCKPLTADTVNFFDQTKDSPAVEVTFKETSPLEAGDPTYISFYNSILRRLLFGMDLDQLGRNFFDRHAAINIPQHKLTLWPGYITTLRQHEDNVLLCVEMTHKVLRTGTALDLIREMEQNPRRDGRAAIVAQFKGTIVMTCYNRKTYRVDDVDFNMNPMKKFDNKDGEPTTFVDYYLSRYRIHIIDTRQPLLLCRPTARDIHRGQTTPIALVPELCQLTGLTDAMRANFTLMKGLSRHLQMGPGERVKAINYFMTRLTGTPELCDLMAKWKLQLHPTLVPVTGRLLPPETILFGGNKISDGKSDWTEAVKSEKMLSPMNLDKWAILVPNRDAGNVDNLIRIMKNVAAPIEMHIQNPVEVVRVEDLRPQGYLKDINSTLQKHENLQLLFVILPNNKLETYSAVKQRLSVEVGMASQCFLAKNLTSKGLRSIATKVVVQMSAKMGGEPWTIKIPLKGLMVVGFDVYKGAEGVRGGIVGAMVSTTSHTFAKYHSTTSIYNSPDEMSKKVKSAFEKCLGAYAGKNGTLPDRVILYRDGVGEGQLSQVVEVELKSILECMENMYAKEGRESPKFTYIVVTRHIHSRGFVDKGGRFDNPLPGTIIDSVITLPERYDFYLVSCATRQGTASPCSYNILYDTQGLNTDNIQRITYKMCHMYFNWSGTVAVPAPCLYAHKLAFLTATTYNGQANDNLSGLLHFL